MKNASREGEAGFGKRGGPAGAQAMRFLASGGLAAK